MTCSDITYYYNIWDSVQRGYIQNLKFIASVPTEILAEYGKINPLIDPSFNPVNTRGTSSYLTITISETAFTVQRGYIPNLKFIASIPTEILAEYGKINPLINPSFNPVNTRGTSSDLTITISETVFREVTYQISNS